jgi:3-methyl-2-oxobutanoate hydroxymethyltransferase
MGGKRAEGNSEQRKEGGMSAHPQEPQQSSGPARKPVTPPMLAEMKAAGQPIVMVTAYDHPSAQIVEEEGVDVVLVGDSAAMTVLGYDSTVPIGMEEMLMLAAAVRRGLRTPLLVGDLPFGSYEGSNEQAVASAQRFVKEAGCDAIKLERGGASVDRARAIAEAGIPVMGHVGLTPQTATALGGFKAQGKTSEQAAQIASEALALQEAGCFAIVFEAVPAAITEAIMPLMRVPVIGIGAGPATDGQVLVFHDLVGLSAGRSPKFVKRFAEGRAELVRGVSAYAREVREGTFPAAEHIYSVDPAELAAFNEWLEGATSDEGTFSHADWDWGP